MPIGPGDDILDAIEAGKADKDIISKYKLSNDQLKNFKALHYGLSSEEMNYDEIGDYFPDLNSYFKGPAPVSAPTQQQTAKPVLEKPDFTKPVREKTISESTSLPGVKQVKQSVETAKNVESLQQKFDRGAKESLVNINKALSSHDDVINNMIQQGKLKQAKEQAYDKFATVPKSDMPMAARLAEARNLLNPQETKPWEQPVTPEEHAQLKERIQTDEGQARDFVNQVSARKPEEGKSLQHSMYLLDAMQRMKTDPNIGIKVNNNLKEINEGKLKYNPLNQQLIKPEGFFPSLVTGIREHARQMDNYDLFQGKDQDVINLLEKRRASYDPDAPVPVPAGNISEIGQMTGMEWKPLLKGFAVGAATEPFGLEGAAPYLSAAINSPEYYKRGYSTALEESYNEFRKQGKTPEESLKLSREQAKTEGVLGAAEGFVSSFIGGRIGLKELPKFNVTGGFKNAVNNFMKQASHGLAETTIEGVSDGLVAGYLQERKDIAAEQKGLFRDSEKNVSDNIKGEVTFAFAMAAMTKAGRAMVDPETYNKIKYWITKQKPEAVQSSLGQMVIDGQMSMDDADRITKELNEQFAINHKVPDDIKDVSRMAMIDKIKKRQDLQEQLETTDEALHPGIKEQIKKLNEEIAEHSTHKKTENESETKTETQADTEAQANGTGVEEPGPENTSQPVAETQQGVGGESAPVADNTSPEQTNENAIPEQGAEGIHVPASPSDSTEVGAGNESQGTVNEEPTRAQEMKIETVEDLDKALLNATKGFSEQKTGNQEQTGKNDSQPLPKLTESNQGSQTPVNPDKTSYTPQSIIDKARETFKGDPLIERVTNFLEPLIKANPNIKINHDAEVPNHVYGYSHNNGSIDLNFNNHPNEGALLQTGLHEMIHAVTRTEIENNSAFRGEIDKALSQVREHMGLPDSDQGVSTAMHLLSAAGMLDESKYGARNAHELIAELFTNKSFRDQLASIKYEGDTLLNKIFQTIAKYLSEAYNKLVGAKKSINANDLAEFLTQLTEKTVTGKQGEDKAGALGMMAPQSQEDAIKNIIKATPKSISDEKLKERIVAATGMDENKVQDLIDEIRKPNVPDRPQVSIYHLSKEERQVSINKINNLLNQSKPKEQSKFSKIWEGIKNASAWMDNPYRFITKITEDINKHYGLPNKEAIPLGRQFEKTASGRAALKIQSFVNEIVNGRINGEKLGKLTGKKYEAFQKYLIAKRVIDRLDTQEAKARAGEDANRQTGNITRLDAEIMLDQLDTEYDITDFEKRGKAFQKHMDTMLQTMVASGLLSKEAYDNIKADNNFYAPFSVVQSQLLASQDKQPVGISGIIKRIKGIDYKLPTTKGEALTMINSLGDALNNNTISPEEYFSTSFQILNDAKNDGLITEKEYNQHIANLENPGFALNDILDAGANMIYKAEGMALRNSMLQRLFAYKASDKEGLFIQDVDGFKTATLPDGSVRKVAKPLDQIKVDPGMAPIKLRVDGKDVIVAVNKNAAEKLTQMSNYETATILKVANVFNKLFRAAVITLSPGFQAVNMMIDFVRTSMLSRYGPLAGKGLTQPLVNAALYMPQYIEALLHSALGNVGIKTDTYKQWMNSDSFSKGMFDNLFDNEKRIKEVSAPLAKRVLMNFIKLHWIEVPGSILEQTHKIATHQRGMSVEGLKPEMVTAMLASIINRNINPNMSATELKDAMDRLNYEVQNFAGSPNFPQTHKFMKATSIFLQFFSARVKGEMTDYRRVANLFSTLTPGVKSGKGEGVKLSRQDAAQIGLQFMGAAGMIAAYAIRNNMKDEDEKEFDGNPPYQQANYLHIPLGYFDYTDQDGATHTLRNYAKIPLRGLTATMNVMANSFVKFYKRQNPEEFKKMAEAFVGNASPVNLQGKDERELGESLASNLTPVFKYFIEYSFNRDTHNHRNIVPDFVQGKGMLSKYRKGELKPWEVATNKTPKWAIDMSKYLYDNLGISINAIELDHMENTMGNPTELYDKAVKKRLFRSEAKYPLYQSKEDEKNSSSATISSTPQ